MGQEVRELAIYMFVVVYQMFQKAPGKIKKISSEEIIECYEHNEGTMERIEGAHDKFVDRVAGVQSSWPPHVVNYVVDALMGEEEDDDGDGDDDDDDEGENAVALTEEQKGFLYLLLKTVIDVLDQEGMKSQSSTWPFYQSC
jgi:hypothetical protein